MRNIHAHIISEYGQKSIKTFRQWGEIGDENGRLQEPQKIHAKMSQQGYYIS